MLKKLESRQQNQSNLSKKSTQTEESEFLEKPISILGTSELRTYPSGLVNFEMKLRIQKNYPI